MAGRRTSLASLAGQRVEDVPGRSDAVLLSVPLDKLHCTRFNPRRNFGTEDELKEFGEKLKKEQLQPAVVVSRAAYLKLWPDEADRAGLATYVIANGERRYRASRLVGRPTLEVVHREDVAASRASFLDAVQSENNDRQDLDPIERAIAIETMVIELDGADQVAAYYGKTKGWVSQQRKLLRLTPELQDLVSGGEMPVRVARDIAGLPAEAQGVAWAEHLERRRLEKEASARLRAQVANPAGPPSQVPAATPPPSFTAVKPEPAPEAGEDGTAPAGEDRFTAVNQQPERVQAYPAVSAPPEPATEASTGQDLAPRPESIPVPRTAGLAAAPEDDHPKQLPYADAVYCVHHLHRKMDAETFARGARVWLKVLKAEHPEHYQAVYGDLEAP